MESLSSPQRLIVIAGPTATGKTALAVELARQLNSEILSVDSRQVYKGLDIGTGKDLQTYAAHFPHEKAIPYHLIDQVAVTDVYGLYRYQQDAYATLTQWRDSKGPWHPMILCGGTGLYLEALLRRYRISAVPEDGKLREILLAREVKDLWDELQSLDPEWAARTDPSSKQRIIRALEVARGRAQGEEALSISPPWAFDPLIFVLSDDRPKIWQRIDRRLQERLDQGMVEEVKALMQEGVGIERLHELGMEYREIGEYLVGHKSYSQMVDDLKQKIHDLAKRQDTWFRNMPKRGLNTIPIRVSTSWQEVFQKIAERWPDLKNRFSPSRPTAKQFALAIIRNEKNEVLFLQRSHQDDFAPGQWGFVGGHLLEGETPERAIEREISEEVGSGLNLKQVKSLAPIRDTHYGGQYEIWLFEYLCLPGGRIELNAEHESFAWVRPEQFRSMNVVLGCDEDLAWLQIWDLDYLNLHNLPEFMKPMAPT